MSTARLSATAIRGLLSFAGSLAAVAFFEDDLRIDM
jgi:hypothetical protein